MAKKKILLTGFEPFGGETINPSQMLVEWMAKNQKEIETLILPVSYLKSSELLLQKLFESKNSGQTYTDVVMLGQAGGRSKIEIEKVALNYAHAQMPDSEGLTYQHQVIDQEAEMAYFSNYDFAKIEKGAKNWNLPLGTSFSAGTYVCNYLSFQVARFAAENSMNWLFVHFPYLPEQIESKQGPVAHLKFSEMQSGLLFLLEHIRDA